MLKAIGNLAGKLLNSGTAGAVRSVASTFVVPKDTRELNEQEYKLAVLDQFKAYTTAEKGSWFERFVGGLNALVRPTIVFGLMAMIFAVATGNGQAMMANLVLLNNFDEFWKSTIAAVLTFYFAGRIQVKHIGAKEQAQRIDNMEKTSQLVMGMIDRLDSKSKVKETTVD